MRHKTKWRSMEGYTLFKDMIAVSSFKPKMLIGTLTGNCKLKAHLHRISPDTGPKCLGCGTDSKTIRHIKSDCPEVADSRESIFGHRWTKMTNLPP